MNKREISIKEATEKWVNTFNAIPQSLLERAFKDDWDNWIELTPENEENEDDENDYYNGVFPMWGYLWSMNDSFEESWILDNLETVRDIGFRIFEDNIEGSIYLGIDGAGYDFYSQHWIPLYKAMGMKWHTSIE